MEGDGSASPAVPIPARGGAAAPGAPPVAPPELYYPGPPPAAAPPPQPASWQPPPRMLTQPRPGGLSGGDAIVAAGGLTRPSLRYRPSLQNLGRRTSEPHQLHDPLLAPSPRPSQGSSSSELLPTLSESGRLRRRSIDVSDRGYTRFLNLPPLLSDPSGMIPHPLESHSTGTGTFKASRGDLEITNAADAGIPTALVYETLPTAGEGDRMVFRALRVNRAEVFGRLCSPFDALLTVLGAAPRRCLGVLFKVFRPLVLGPLLFLGVLLLAAAASPEVGNKKAVRTGGVLLWMGVWWLTEAVPVAVTSVLPAVLWPLLGVMTANDVAKAYANDAIALVFGSFMMALAVQRWDLDTRLALNVFVRVGNNPRVVMFVFMCMTAFLCLWMSNTATAALMIPMVLVVLKAPDQKAAHPEVGTPAASVAFAEAAAPSPSPPLHKAGTLPAASGRKGTSIAVDDASYRSTSQPVLPVMMTMTPADLPGPEAAVLMKRTPETSGSGASWGPEGLTRSEENLVKAMILAVTYTCSFTGYATLTGTGPNLVLAGIYPQEAGGKHVSFFSWFLFAAPLCLVYLVLGFVAIQLACCREDQRHLARLISVHELRKELHALPPLRAEEIFVMVDYLICIGLWFTRDLGPDLGGWGRQAAFENVGNGTVALLCTVALFMAPATSGSVRPAEGGAAGSQGSRIMDWDTAVKLKWGTLILIAGGFALSEGVQASGLSQEIGGFIYALGIGELPPAASILLVTWITALCTDWLITSNVAVAALLLPIASSISRHMGHSDPLFLMVPATIGASLSFCSPVATPPNAIAYATGMVPVVDFIRVGLLINVLGVGLVTAASYCWAPVVFGY